MPRANVGSEMNPRAKLAELGLSLPPVVPPVAAYVPAVQSGNHVYVSGQLPIADGALLVPSGPGLGVALDEETVTAHRVDVGA